MRRVIACTALAALLVAASYAPLVHVHVEEAGEAPLVHGHLLELEHDGAEDFVHVEPFHDSHHNARWIDIFTTTAAHVVTLDAIVLTSYISLQPAKTCCGFVSVAAPRAHAPPGLLARIPRSPPA